MAYFSISNVRLAGISATVPKKIISNLNHPYFSQESMNAFVKSTGVEERRIAERDQTTSDLCFEAAENLIRDLKWNKDDIEVLVLVTQTADYKLPVTSAILQHRLGLPKTCMALDIPLGCSGYIYGISTIASLLSLGYMKKGILLVGETNSKVVSPYDKSTEPLFGDAGTATAFEYDPIAEPIPFNLGTDGSGYKSIIIPAGGAREKIEIESLEYVDVEEGIKRNSCSLVMDGMDVFSFGISRAPQNVRELMNLVGKETEDIAYFVFHQANMFMNNKITKKLKLPEEKVPYSLSKFGNTSSATIPLTIVSQLRNEFHGINDVLCCGFGVGLSWGSCILRMDNIIISELTEI